MWNQSDMDTMPWTIPSCDNCKVLNIRRWIDQIFEKNADRRKMTLLGALHEDAVEKRVVVVIS